MWLMSVDTVKQRERAQQIALFRYQLICPALEPGLSTKQRGRIVRAIADRDHAGPFSGRVRYSRESLDRWMCATRRLVVSPA